MRSSTPTEVVPLAPAASRTPFLRGRPAVPVLLALDLFAMVFLLRLQVAPGDARITVLYVVPVAVLALVFGARGGALAGLGAIVLVALWTTLVPIPVDFIGWMGRAAPLLLVGLIVGAVSDELRVAAVDDAQSFARRLAALEADELEARVVAPLLVARAHLERGDVERGLDALRDGVAATDRLITELRR